MAKPSGPQWYTIREAAEYLQVGEPTLYRWMRDNRITYRKIGDSTRFLQKDLDDIVQVHHRKEDATKVQEVCSLCGGDELVPGNLQSTGKLSFYPVKTKFWQLQTSDVKTSAKMCVNCGAVFTFGDLKKLEKLREAAAMKEDESSE